MRTLTSRRYAKSSRYSNCENTMKVCSEPWCYDGPKLDVALSSCQMLVSDILKQVGFQPTQERLAELVKPLQSFIRVFFTELEKRKDGSQVKDFVDKCKKRRNDLLSFLNLFLAATMTEEDAELMTLFTIGKKSANEPLTLRLDDLNYFPKSIMGFVVQDNTDYSLPESLVLAEKPRFYIYLYTYVLKLRDYLYSHGITSYSDDRIQLLFLYASTVGQIYEKVNPSKSEREHYIQDALERLTSKENEISDEFIQCFKDVLHDLDLGNTSRKNYPNYVREFRRAYQKAKPYLSEPYNTKDYYAALKGTASQLGKYHNKSLIASLYELDPIGDIEEVKRFDEAMGYLSKYRKYPISVEYHQQLIKTVLINNPSKYKPRIIHIAMNAIQDRCKFIHRRLAKFLHFLPTDCMEDHYQGVQFFKLVSNPAYRREHENNLYCFDFSNATDTLSQWFQGQCLGIIFPQVVVDFWLAMSRLPKVMIHSDGTEEVYYQTAGQPQGLLGSFDAFSLAHHIIMLMTMKACGLEDHYASEFYRIVGDDSAISSIIPDPDNLVGDTYCRFCEEANLTINRDKSTEIIGLETEHAMLDFAKVTIRDGKEFTPIPVGLGLTYSDKESVNDIATLLWLAKFKVKVNGAMDDVLNRRFPKPLENLLVKIITKCGQIPYLKQFEDKDFIEKCDPWIVGSAIFIHGICTFKGTVLNYLLPDHLREEAAEESKYDVDTVLKEMIPWKWIEEFREGTDEEHKFNILCSENAQLAEQLQAVFNTDANQSEALAAIISNSDTISDIQYIREYYQLALAFKDQMLESDEFEAEVPYFLQDFQYEDLFSNIGDVERLQIRSVRKKYKQRASFLKRLTPEYLKVFRKSKFLSERVTQSIDNLYS